MIGYKIAAWIASIIFIQNVIQKQIFAVQFL